jgi:eukaryotic-like serine/threonine-protein kinase
MLEYQTLSEKLAEGQVSFSEALSWAVQLGDALRRLHETGSVHGGLTPSAIAMTPAGAELLEAAEGSAGQVNPYWAPERVRGQAPDAAADIFAFGALVYEMLAGRPAFEGDSLEALSESISNTTPPPIGHAALDRLILTCLAKDRAGRWQRMQQVMMELKLLAASERRSEPGVGIRHTEIEASFRTQLREMEERWAGMFERQQEGIAAVAAALTAVREQLAESDRRFAGLEESLERTATLGRRQMTDAQDSLEEQMRGVYKAVKEHAYAVQAIRAGLSRTDDVVEQVVDALGSLQSMVLVPAEERLAIAS